jgi:hypothetical protein
MRSQRRPLALLAIVTWCALAAVCSTAGEADQPSDRELRTAMNRAEKRFFDIYNDVNKDSRHRMNCENEDRAGSRLRKSRTCRTQGETDINADAAKEYLRGRVLSADVESVTVTGQQAASARDFGGPVSQQATSPSSTPQIANQGFTDPGIRLREERAAFEKHMDELFVKHPELKQAFDEYLLARTRYEAARR